MTTSRSKAIVQKHGLIIAVVLLVVVGGAIWASHVSEAQNAASAPPATAKVTDLNVGHGDITKSAAAAATAAEYEAMKRRIADLEEAKRRTDQEKNDFNTALERQRTAAGTSPWGSPPVEPPRPPAPAPMPAATRNPVNDIVTNLGGPPPAMPFAITPGSSAASAPGQRVKSKDIPTADAGAGALPKPAAPGYDGEQPLPANRAQGQSASTYVTAGTFCRAIVLVGMDAPAGGQAQSNPVPAQFEIIDDCVSPNGRSVRLKGCFVTGNGYGELSAERAYIRTDRMSCIDDDDAAIDIAVKGHAVGEDGKPGLRGPVVSKQGTAIANSIYAALASGMGRALTAAGTAQTTSPLTGAVTTTTTDGFRSGFGDGVSKGFDKISDYYLKLADKLYPTISVNSLRVIDITFSQGFAIDSRKLAGE